MDLMIFANLTQDGVVSGAIYALLALALVLVFSVTRIILVPQGEFVAYGALTFAALQMKLFPPTVWFAVFLGVISFGLNLVEFKRSQNRSRRNAMRVARSALYDLGVPAAAGIITWMTYREGLHTLVSVLLTLLIVMPIGRQLYRIVYQRIAENSILLLLIVSVAAHLVLTGVGLVMFGPEGSRVSPLWDTSFNLGLVSISGQSISILAFATLLVGGLYLYFNRTLSGSALKATAVNRVGAGLMGIEIRDAGTKVMTLGAGIGAMCGILIAPTTTVYYDSGFLIVLKGFVGAIVGALASYPIAAGGALFVGLLEAFSSFWASAYKEVIVFTLIIPVLLWLSLSHSTIGDEEEA